jgi:hypothetical protein
LQDIISISKVKYYPYPSTPALFSNKISIQFFPSNSDESDQIVDLLIDELVMRGLPPTGGLEELHQKLLQEIELEHRLKEHLDKLTHCNALDACLISLLHKIPCILHCKN